MLYIHTKQRGFTLIELMVVISIIAILSAVVFASYSGARTDARNKAMRTTLKQTQLALETYRAQNDIFPGTLSSLQPDFIADLPDAAQSANTGCSINYQVGGGGVWYKLTAVNCIGGAANATEGTQATDELARCPSTCGTCTSSNYAQANPAFYESVAVYSAGGECQ